MKQTRLPDEVVISDDLSTDETEAIVERFRRTAPFAVTFISNTGTHGATRNFENALLHCSNDLILLSDQDDVWLPNHVERLASLLESDSRIQCVSSNGEIVDDELRPKGYTPAQSERYSKTLYQAMMRFPREAT